FTRDEFQDGATLLVHPERFGRRVEARAMKVLEESVYRWCPGPGSSADGVAHLGCSAQVAAEGLFLHAHILSAPRMAGLRPASFLDAGMAERNRPGALRRLLDPFANERVVLSTRLSASECSERLGRRDVSLLAPSSWFSLSTARPVHGRVSADGFALKRRHTLTRQTLITQASGRYEDRAGATLVRVRIGLSLPDRVWTFVFLGFVAMVTFVFTAASPTSNQDLPILGVFPVLDF